MTEKELNKILDDHQTWLNGEGGARADLRDANLLGANLSWANLRDANLKGTVLSWTDLRDADLKRADLRKADLSWADLKGADLKGADLIGADLSEANLKGVNLDFSCMPLWCGDLKTHYDEKQIIQQLYHVLSHVKYSKNSTDRLKEVLLKDEIVNLANKFHRVEECGEITK